jgi:DNA-directed RNA polymerase subunit K/omega
MPKLRRDDDEDDYDDEEENNSKSSEEDDENSSSAGEEEVPEIEEDDDDEENQLDEDEEEEEDDDMNDDDDEDDESSSRRPDEDDDEEEEDMFTEFKSKFDQTDQAKYLERYHPEEIHLPFEQIHLLSCVQRDQMGKVIPDENHKTYPILSKYEKAKIIGLRVSQLNNGAAPYIPLNRIILDKSLIAEKELRDKKLDSWIIRRPLPNGKSEYWRVNDLEFID